MAKEPLLVVAASAAPAITNALEKKGRDCIFPYGEDSRSKLVQWCVCASIAAAEREVLDVWTLKYIVGASYSYETHSGYVQMSKEDAALKHICDCYSE